MSSYIGLTGSRGGRKKEKVERYRRNKLVSARDRKRDPHGTACMSHYVVSWCRAEPVTLLIKASLSRVSGSFSLSADFSLYTLLPALPLDFTSRGGRKRFVRQNY